MTLLLSPRPAPLTDTSPGDPAGSVAEPLCRSFWCGGFEGADHVNVHGQPLDMVDITGHAMQVDEDFARLAARGLRTVRESIGWRLAETRPGVIPQSARFDFSRLRRFAAAADRHGIQVLWTLMHYGTPPGLHVMAADFVGRFRDFAAATARELRRLSGAPSVYTPINEISFLASVIAHTDIIHGQSGRGPNGEALDGYVVKHRLVEAALAAIDAIAEEDRGARFLHVEPVIHVTAPPGRPDLHDAALTFSGYQWQAWDMLLGRMAPELGGSPRTAHLIGINHYHDAQWEFGGPPLGWPSRDTRRRSFSSLLQEVWERYRLPLFIAETSHVGYHRAPWLDEIATETCKAIAGGVPVQGLCLYPVVDRPDWNDLTHWHHSGLWDVIEDASFTQGPVHRPGGSTGVPRHIDEPYARTLARWQQQTAALGIGR